jgi:ATP-dependent helicase/DNAse subunit B
MHAVAEGFVCLYRENMTKAEITSAAKTVLDKTLKKESHKKIETGVERHVLHTRLLEEAVQLCISIADGINSSVFKPVNGMLEYRFSTDEITGFIDRVETYGEYVRIIDYKTGRIDTALKNIYTGRNLQLPAYLKAAAEKTGKIPVGAYYFPIRNEYEKLSEKEKSPIRLLGYVTAAVSLPAEQMRKDITFSQIEMEGLFRYTGEMIIRAKREIKKGNIKMSPFKGACDYCDFKIICDEFCPVERDTPAVGIDHFNRVGET